MPSCLGLYIDKNIIKYAKVSRDKTSTKVEAFWRRSIFGSYINNK